MMCVEKIMFALIRSEICGTSVGEDLQSTLSEEEYRELYNLSRKHDLSHIVASALSHIGFFGDDDISLAFRKELKKSLYREAQREYAMSLTEDLFEQSNIPHIVLKGAVICHLYPETWMRTSCDVDILIHESNVELVEDLLCSNNYVRLDDSSTHDCVFLSPNKIHIEIHHTLTQDGELSVTDELLKSVWDDYAIPEPGFKNRYSMTAELFIIYHLAHMGRHLLHGGCGIRPFIDLWLINKRYSVDSSKLNDLLIRCNLLELYNCSTELSKVWLEDYKHNEITEQLEKYILCGGVYGTSANAAKVEAASGIGKMRSFFNLMFLTRENLEVIYPNLKKHPILFPFYQIKRWFRYMDRNKRIKVRRLNMQRNMVTTDETNETSILLNQLGLI